MAKSHKNISKLSALVGVAFGMAVSLSAASAAPFQVPPGFKFPGFPSFPGFPRQAPAPIATGPSSSQAPYVVPVAPGVLTRSILTVGDSVNNKPDGTPYRMVGIPDGLGAYTNLDGTFTLLMNHELGNTAGIQRAHGAVGAFVSKWRIRINDLRVLSGEDLIQNTATWNPGTSSYNAPAKGVVFNRFCSADLPGTTAFYNPRTRTGTQEKLLLNGEEAGAEGRGFAHAMNGVSYELPRLGKFSYENSLAHPYSGDRTIVVSTDDSTPGQVYVYIGTKTKSGSVVERAGLTNGQLYGLKVEGYTAEDSATGIGGVERRFSLVPLGNVENKTGAQLEADSNAAGVMRFLRPEDGHWNPADFNHFAFVSTNAFNAPSRLWSLHFDNYMAPELGGTIVANINTFQGQQMFDNMTIDMNSRALLQEDPGGQDYLARIHQYRFDTNELTPVAQHAPDRFTPGVANFLTRDEEASGIIEAPFLGQGWYLMDVQAHYNIPGELVQGGQLLAMQVPIPQGARRANFPGQFTRKPQNNRR